MLTAYDKQEDVPEALREHYSKRDDGKWHADIPTDHPAVKHNAKLLSEKQTAQTKVTELESNLETAKASGLPRGHVAVAKAEAELLEKVKALGTVDEIATKLTEHAALKEETERQKLLDNQTAVAKDLGYNPDAFVLLPNLPEFEKREKDGKPHWIAKVKEGVNIVEKPALEFIESSDSIAPLLPALKQTNGGTRVHGTSGSGGTPPKDVYTKIREASKEKQKQAETDMNPFFKQNFPGRAAHTGE